MTAPLAIYLPVHHAGQDHEPFIIINYDCYGYVLEGADTQHLDQFMYLADQLRCWKHWLLQSQGAM